MKEYGSLRRKMMATTLAFSLLPLFALGASIYYQFYSSYTTKIHANLETIVENKKRTIDLFLDERVAQLANLAATHSLDRLSDEQYLLSLLAMVQRSSRSLIDLGVINQEGEHVAYAGPYNLLGVNYKNERWFQEVMLRGLYVSDVFTGFRKFPHFIIAVMRREGGQCWILRATIDSNIFNTLVRSVQFGAAGDAYLLNQDGVLQTPARFGGDVLDTVEMPGLNHFLGSKVVDAPVKGRGMMVGKTWLEKKDWLLVVMEDPSEEMSPLFAAGYMGFGLMGAGVLVIFLGTYMTTGALVQKLAQADRDKAALDAGLIQSNKMAALGKMAAGVAHEINNPLTMINESAGWARDILSGEGPPSDEDLAEVRSAIAKIESHVDRAKTVTHRMLGFARRMEPVSEQVDLNRVAEQTIAFLGTEAASRGIAVARDFQADLPTTLSDTSQLQQVVLNILDNALDAVGRDGSVTLATSHHPAEREIRLSVSDTGPGIPKDKLDKIFDPFFTTKKPGEGTGLGLAITYSIVEKLGGSIRVESEEGQGATFTVALPIRN